jgi:riboflavin transporter FmnP
MNTGRFAGAVIGVWIVRVALNATFYTQIVGQQFEQMSSAHPGMFRTVIPAYIVTDLIFALVFTFLFVKVGAALGGSLKAGVTLG